MQEKEEIMGNGKGSHRKHANLSRSCEDEVSQGEYTLQRTSERAKSSKHGHAMGAEPT